MFTNKYEQIVDYKIEVSRGNVLDATAIHKFGLAEDIDTGDGVVDIWDGAANDIGGKVNPYNWIIIPQYLQISSNSLLDVGTIITVEGLDQNGLEQIEEVVLNGNVGVGLVGIYSAVNRAWNSGPVGLQGYVFISDDGEELVGGRPVETDTIRAIIHMEYEQTQMALYTVPSNKALYLTHGWGHISKSSTTEAVLQIYMALEGGVFRAIHTLALQSIGSSGDQRPYDLPLRLEPSSRIIYRAQVYSNSTAISAGFHGILIKE